jgi:hypothetical protein
MSSDSLITPTRRISSKERKVFDRVLSSFEHLQASDAEQLTSYSEAVVRYETAAKECKEFPTIEQPVVNRASGNIVGHKVVRNTAHASMKEAGSQMISLARRLLIDTASANKRMTLLSKRARALRAQEEKDAEKHAGKATDAHIREHIKLMLKDDPTRAAYSSKALYEEARWQLDVYFSDEKRWSRESEGNT